MSEEKASIYIKLDRTGFPMVGLGEVYISLFPVSKYQFERFNASVNTRKGGFPKKWYRAVCRANPGISWQDWGETPWRLFMTGLNPTEINRFLKSLGPGYRLPSVDEWKTFLDREVDVVKAKREIETELSRLKPAPPVSCWLKNNLFPMMSEGMIEMVADDDGQYRALGRPWQSFLPNTWKPHQPRGLYQDRTRLGYVGFRLACEIWHLI